MKYYEHHLGDYLRDTMHLTLIEDGAYRRLIDAYYSREAPLPKSLATIYRLIRAESKRDKAAIQNVLKEFFVASQDGYRHVRCDQEIARYLEKQAKARGSANARWSNNGRNADAMRTQCVGNALQSPISNHQEKESETKNGLFKTTADLSRHTAAQVARIRATKT